MQQPAPRAGRREWLGLAVLALPCVLYSMDMTVLVLALPQIAAALRPGPAQLLWIVDIYGFLVSGFLILMGALGDRIGRRRLLMWGAGVFSLASLLAAFAPTAELLVLARALLGVAAATLAPSTLSLIRNMFLDPRQRQVAIGVWVASFSAGGALGPFVGGLLVQWFWWGSVFLVAVPLVLPLLVLGPRMLPEFRDPQAGRLDVASAAMSLLAVLPLVYGIKRAATSGADAAALAAVAAGVAVAVLFLRRQARLADPMIDLRLFRVPGFGLALSVNVLVAFVMFAGFYLASQYLQLVLGMGPLQAGLWTVPSGLGFIAGSLLAPQLLRRFAPVAVMAGGMALAALGLACWWIGRPDALQLTAGFVLLSIGMSPVSMVTTDLVVGAAPPEKAGMASAMSETGFELGAALGIAVLGSLAAAIYRLHVDAEALPQLPPAALETARGTLGQALALARELPEAAAAALRDTARHAYALGLRAISAIGSALLLALALLCHARLRRAAAAAGAA
ncbi:MAG TPA: MFS transporter [Pseudoxanthomonas sp.]|nr:MFS transporter [Pseudoxanthomonas sp.]